MLLFLMAARLSATTRLLAVPTRRFEAFWMIWLTSLRAARSASWLLARLLYSAMSSLLSAKSSA